MQDFYFLKNIYTKLFSDKGLSNRAILNGAARLLDYGTRFLLSLLINPLLVTGLGDYLFGVWQILGRTLTYITAASGQPTQTIKLIVANRQHSNDAIEKQRSVGSAVIAWLIFLPIFVLIGGLAIWILPFALKTPAYLVPTVRFASTILIINLSLNALVGLPNAVLQGENLGYKRTGCSILILVIGGGATVLALSLGMGIIGVAITTVLTSLFTGGIYYSIARKHVGWFGIRKPTQFELRTFISLNGWVLGWELVSTLLLSGDVVFLGLIGSAELVTSYTLTKYLAITITNLTMMVISSALPGLGGLVGTNQTRKVESAREDLMAFVWLASVITGMTILFWNQEFVSLWVGKKYFAGEIQTFLIVLMSLQLAIIRLDANIIDLTLKVRTKFLLGLVSLGVSLLLSWLLMNYYEMGVAGFCLGIVLGRLILSIGYPYLVGKFIGISFVNNLKNLLRPFGVLVLLSLIVMMGNDSIPVNTWPSLFFWFLITAVIIFVFVFWGSVSRDRRKRLSRYVLRFTG